MFNFHKCIKVVGNDVIIFHLTDSASVTVDMMVSLNFMYLYLNLN